MNTVEPVQYSLSFAFQVLDGLVTDVTQEQADWQPPGTANPIGALYWHVIAHADQIAHDWGMGQASLRQRDGWQEKVVITRPATDPEDPFGELWAVREGLCVDLAALHDYAQATSQAIQEWVASLRPEDLERTVNTTIGELAMGQMIEAYIVWHVNVHCGEIAALKGCQGLKGYPW
jgi:hypothetical protein